MVPNYDMFAQVRFLLFQWSHDAGASDGYDLEYVTHSISAPNSRTAEKFCGVWSHCCCYTHCLNSSHPMWLGCSTGGQNVRNAPACPFTFLQLLFRVMTISLVMMLAALSYCMIDSCVLFG